MTDRGRAHTVLTLNTLAFTVCFACWTMNGVLVAHLIDQQLFTWDAAQIGWLIGIPVLSGSILRLPVGVLTDKYGGRIVFTVLMLVSAVPMYLMSYANSFDEFMWGSLGFGLAGAGFAVGIAYTSVWFPPERQGTALGIFGIGNAGSAVTSMGAPFVLRALSEGGNNPDGWRALPQIYAAALVVMSIVFYLTTYSRRVAHGHELTLVERLAPLKSMRVWRFGLYYFLVFGAFVALAQWLIPYYVNVYAMSVVTAGLMASIFSLPSGVIRALGGWMSDKFGARNIMYWVFGFCLVGLAGLCVPRMDIQSPGEGVMAARAGTVTAVSPTEIVVDGRRYPLRARSAQTGEGLSAACAFWPANSISGTTRRAQHFATNTSGDLLTPGCREIWPAGCSARCRWRGDGPCGAPDLPRPSVSGAGPCGHGQETCAPPSAGRAAPCD